MPPAAEQVSYVWEIVAGLILLAFSTSASVAGAMFSRASRAETQLLKNDINTITKGQDELKTSLTRVHERIDGANKEIACVDGKVSKLEGRAESMEKIFDKVRIAV